MKRKKRNSKFLDIACILFQRGFAYYVQEWETCMKQNKTVMKVFVLIVSAFFICWTYIVLQKLFTSLRFTKDSFTIFVSLFFYIFFSLMSFWIF